jgi:hypothetical protein
LAKYEHYINVYCWISNTYYVSFKEQTTSLTNKPERMLKYYQWVPMILLSLAFMFLLPRFLYRFLSKQSGLDILNLADAAINYMSVEKFDKRRRILLYLANSIHFYSICNKSKRTKGGFGTSSSTFGPTIGSPILGTSSSKPYLYNLLCCHGKLNGSYLALVYVFTKLMYIGNSLAQLFILNIFLGFNYNSHGLHALRDITKGILGNSNSLNLNRKASPNADEAAARFASNLNIKSPNVNPPIMGPTVIFESSDGQVNFDSSGSSSSGYFSDSIYSEPTMTNNMMHRYFPRESACDFRIRANIDSLVHNYTVQCVLPINLYNEQLFTLLWAWLWLVCIANCYDLIVWLYRLTPGSRYNYIRSRLRLKYSESSVKKSLTSFVYDYLTFDGVFVMRIMSLSMSDCVTHEIIQTLWQNYTETARGRQAAAAASSGAGGGGVASSGGGGGSSAMVTSSSSGPSTSHSANLRAGYLNQRYSMRHPSMANPGGNTHIDNEFQDARYQSTYTNVVENI